MNVCKYHIWYAHLSVTGETIMPTWLFPSQTVSDKSLTYYDPQQHFVLLHSHNSWVSFPRSKSYHLMFVFTVNLFIMIALFISFLSVFFIRLGPDLPRCWGCKMFVSWLILNSIIGSETLKAMISALIN